PHPPHPTPPHPPPPRHPTPPPTPTNNPTRRDAARCHPPTHPATPPAETRTPLTPAPSLNSSYNVNQRNGFRDKQSTKQRNG
ncbi:hypothetical protein H8E65_12650, partial [Candidatus Bathyarchaeota archaeon]|nr:hypothetical protein [Candidatus Bathyarchaeota archaeon]